MHIADPTAHFTEGAFSTEFQLTHDNVLRLAGVENLCREREAQGAGPCTIHVGHHMQPRDQDLAVLHGLGITIRIPPLLNEFEAEQNLERRVQILRRTRQGHIWDPREPEDAPESDHPAPRDPGDDDQPNDPEDEISFMARQLPALPAPQETALSDSYSSSYSSRTSSTSSSSTSGTDWRRTVVFTLDGVSISALLPWHDYDLLLDHIAIALSIDRQDILRFQVVQHRPIDYVQVGLHCILLQRRFEFRPSPFVRLALADVELHVAQEVQPTPFKRSPVWVRYVTDRASLLRDFGLSSLCGDHDNPCRVWRNNIVIDATDAGPIASFRWGLHQDFSLVLLMIMMLVSQTWTLERVRTQMMLLWETQRMSILVYFKARFSGLLMHVQLFDSVSSQLPGRQLRTMSVHPGYHWGSDLPARQDPRQRPRRGFSPRGSFWS